MKLTKDAIFFKDIEKPIAFVFGDDNVSILGVIRNFGKVNIPSVVLNSKKKRQIFSFSKYCINIVCPDPINNEKKFIDFLLDLGKKLKVKGVLFPTSDVYVHILLKHRTLLEEYFIFSVAELNVVEKLLDKTNFYSVLEQENIPHPRTFFPDNINDLPEIVKGISLPCIIKPAHSGYFRLDFDTKFFVAKTKEDIIKYYSIAAERNHRLVIQEIIPVETSNQYGFNAYYDRNYNPHGFFMYNKIRDLPVFGGVGCYLKNVEIPELEKITTSLIKKIKYYGIVDAEFIRDPRDGSFKLIEINPRIWLQNSFPGRCGINLPYMAYMNAIEKNIEEVKPTKCSVKWLYFYEDIPSALRNIKRGTLTLYEWIKSYNGKKEYAIFTWDDPLPTFVSFINYIFIEFPYLLYGKLKNFIAMFIN